MSIHECFTGLRDRLGVCSGPMMVVAAHTRNTTIASGVSALAEEKSYALQSDKKEETPATPGTPPYVHTDADWQELYEERAAIMEFDGGLSRPDAERAAHEFIQQQMREEDHHAEYRTIH